MSLYRIMVVDDEAEVRQGIVRKINWNALGFEIVADAENGREAIEKAESLELDVVLTDIKMPFMDGQIGRASCRERVCLHVAYMVVALSITQNCDTVYVLVFRM